MSVDHCLIIINDSLKKLIYIGVLSTLVYEAICYDTKNKT